MSKRSQPPPLSVCAANPPKRRRRTRSIIRAKMPLFSEHISNMYYSGIPSYHSSYSYGSSFVPLGSSYSASYLNPGGSYSNHSSLGGYTRKPITSRWISGGRTYSPMLSTISERGTSTPIRINSPRRTPIQNRANRTYVSANYTPRPVNINTADIDVSRDKYQIKAQSSLENTKKSSKEHRNNHEEKSPSTPRVEEKPKTGIDTSPGTQRGVIKRERTVVRLHTLKRKERDSPRKPVDDMQKRNDYIKSQKDTNDCENKEESTQSKRWREKLSEDLIYKDTREKKTLGEKLIEKFQVKNKDTDVTNEENKNLNSVIHDTQNIQNNNISSKSPDRRCSMELLAEQACLLDSLIRKENLSTATLDLSKIGTSQISSDSKKDSGKETSDNSKEYVSKNSPLTTTKSDHSLHSRLNDFRDQKHTTKRRSIKKSSSGGNISKLDSITEFPKDLNEIILPAIEETRQSYKNENTFEQKPKAKLVIKTKITSTVKVTPPSSPLKFRIENITVEEKPRTLRKEVMFSSEVDNADNLTNVNKTEGTSPKSKITEDIKDPASPEPEDGNFWNKIGKRETVYLITRKQKLEKAKENQQRALLWYPEEHCNEEETVNKDNKNCFLYTDNIDVKNNYNATKLNSMIDYINDGKETSEQINYSEIPSPIANNSCNISTVSVSKLSEDCEICLGTKSSQNEYEVNEQVNFAKDIKFNETCNDDVNNKLEFTVTSKCLQIPQALQSSKNTNDNQVTQNCNKKYDNPSDSAAKQKSVESKKKTKEHSLSKQVITSDKQRKLKKVTAMKTEEKIEQTQRVTEDIGSEISDNLIRVTTSNNTLHRQCEIDSEINLKVNIKDMNSRDSIIKESAAINYNIKNEMNTNNVEIHNIDNLKNNESKGLNINSNENLIELNEENKDLSSVDNVKSCDDNDSLRLLLEVKDIPGEDIEKLKKKGTEENSKKWNVSKKENGEKNTTRASVKLLVNTKPVNPVKEEKALKPLIATPRPLQKKAPQLIRSTSTSETSSDEETSDEDEEESNSSEESNEFFECENQDGRTSTGSNDSGFDSSASTSPAGFICVRKDCDVNCHRKCGKLTANLCGVNQRLLVEALGTRTTSRRGGECPSTSAGTSPCQTIGSDILEQELEQSTAYGLFKKTGRFTPPARSIPRFRKYTIEDFQFIKVLGKGSFGKVLLAELRDTEYYYAVKCLKKDVVLEDDDVECTLIERKVLALGTNHPYLCHLFATFQTDSHLFFVMEYLNGGDLMFHIQQSGRFPEPRARFYAAEIVSGLKFLHKRGIIYRDLKLDNILLDFEGHVRIADFGMCKLQIYLDKTADTFCGTPDYMAPEIIKGLKYNQTVDWWSFGVLLYEMLIGQSPFSGCDEDELFWSICNEMPSYPRFLSQEALSILTRLLDKDARSRLGGVECMHGDVRDQDFFRTIAWDRLDRRDLEAPFKPRVRHPLDTQYFDRTFTGERPRLTAVEPHVLRSMDQEPFRGFSYTNPNATDR